MEERKDINQAEDAREVIELMKELTPTEKAQVKGVMIGLQMAREVAAASA